MKRALIVASVLLNLVVLSAVVWMQLGGGQRMIVRSFIGPAHDRWVSQFEALPVSPGDIVFLGDSITEGGAWHELFPRAPVRNRGIGGDTTVGVLARLHQVTDGQPGRLFLKIGTNDLAFGRSEDEIVANVAETLDRVAVESPGTRTYLQSVLPRGVRYRARVEALNARLSELAGQKGVTFVDLYPHFLAEDGSIRNELANDELHLLGAGYLLWREQIAPYVMEGPEG